ncbi:MAG TPA: DNA repair protein RecO [Planctomycetota bacterium]|nr:DNA repair protein RecO [Planctomycetota bacterium]
MQFHRSPAVCLHKVDYSETSQVLRFFTPDSGKINCIAKGSKRKKSAFLAPFELLSVYDLIRIEKRPGTLDILTRAERVRSFTKLRANYPSYVAACYAAEFTDEFAPEGQPIEGLYELLIQVLERFEAGVPSADAIFSFEAMSLRALGYLPRLRECGVCRKATSQPDLYFSVRDGGALHLECRPREERWFPVRRGSLESIARFSEGDMPKEAMKRPLVVEIRQIFEACVRFHLERDLKSARYLRETITSAGTP